MSESQTQTQPNPNPPAPPLRQVAVVEPNLLPPAVRRMGAQADRLIQEATEAARVASGQPPTPGAEATPGRQVMVVTDASPGQGQSQPVIATVVDPTHTEGQTPGQPQGQTPGQTPEPWEQRYNTLKGKYDREIPQLQADRRALEGQIGSLQYQITQLQMQRQQAPAPAQGQGQGPGQGQGQGQARPAPGAASAEDIEAYGEEFITKAQTWGRAAVAPELQAMREQLEQMRARADSAANSQAANTVYQALDQQVQDWRTINDSAEFMDWLKQRDPFSGNTRLEMLGNAFTSGDAPRTTAFFTAYIAEQTALRPSQPAPSHTPQPGAAAVELASLAAPGRGRPASNGAQPNARIWTQPEIAAFYSDISRGRYANNPAQRQAQEADIFAAAGEGRIR